MISPFVLQEMNLQVILKITCAGSTTFSSEKEARKKLHYLRCPKCGALMQAVKIETIEIDKCPECLGIYFDNEELERLLEFKFEQRRTLFHKVFGLK